MLNISEMKCNDIQKNVTEKRIGLVKTGNFLAFDLISGNDFKAKNIPTLACHIAALSIGMDK